MSFKILNTEIAMPLDLPFECDLNLALRLLWIVPFDFQFDRLALAVTQQCELDPVNPYNFQSERILQQLPITIRQ